nr:Cna B-type domain-containing protein [Enterococcus faecalis]
MKEVKEVKEVKKVTKKRTPLIGIFLLLFSLLSLGIFSTYAFAEEQPDSEISPTMTSVTSEEEKINSVENFTENAIAEKDADLEETENQSANDSSENVEVEEKTNVQPIENVDSNVDSEVSNETAVLNESSKKNLEQEADKKSVLVDEESDLTATSSSPSSTETSSSLLIREKREANRSSSENNSFQSLKETLEDPSRSQEIWVSGGEYHFTDTITVAKDLTLRNRPNEKVLFIFDLKNDNNSSLGKTVFNVLSGRFTLAGETNDSIIFDGLGKEIEKNRYENMTNTSDKGTFITVHKDAEVIIDHATFQNSYNSGMQSAPLYVNGGKLIFNDGLLKGNLLSHSQTIGNASLSPTRDLLNGESSSAGIGVRNQGEVVINNGQFLNNRTLYDSGAVIANTGSLVTVNGGIFEGNHSAVHGGVIFTGIKGTTTISDGKYINNTSDNGGGVLFFDWASNGTIDGGYFSKNNSQFGGVIGTSDRYILGSDTGNTINPIAKDYTHEQWKRMGYGVHLTINDGLFDSNHAFVGGALYISSDDTIIKKATIRNNEATRYGGGIYLSSVPYVLKLNNIYIHNNQAVDDKDIPLVMSNLKDKVVLMPGSGGGIWYCPTGTSEIYVSNGVAFDSNLATHSGDDFTSVRKEKDTDFLVTLDPRMLGGGKVYWYIDGDNENEEVSRYSDKQVEFDISNVVNHSISLKTTSNEGALQLARQAASVIFENNIAARGGAIGTNGSVIFGDKGKDFTLEVKKDWSAELENEKKEVTIELLVKYGNKEFLIDTVQLNEQNNWYYQFTHLPLEAGNQPLEYVVRESGNEYVVTYSDNNVSSLDIEPDSLLTIVVHNSKPIEPEQPTVPEEPEVPTEPDKPVEPEQPTVPEEPNRPEKPVKPDQPILPGTPTVPTKTTKVNQTKEGEKHNKTSLLSAKSISNKETHMKEFPKTGEKEAIYLVLLGFIFIVASLVVLTKKFQKNI